MHNKKINRLHALLFVLTLTGKFWGLTKDMKAEERKANAELDSYHLNIPEVFEYADTTVDLNTFVSKDLDTYTHKVNESVLNEEDLSKTGTREVQFEVSIKDYYNRTYKKTLSATYTVADTQYPKIALSENEIEVTEGAELTLSDYVESVSDPVDGPLEYSEEQKAGSYWFDGNLDLNTPGKYEIEVVAEDKNGNQSSETINVTVEANPAVSSSGSVNFDVLFKYFDAGYTKAAPYIDAGYITRFYGDLFHHNTPDFLDLFFRCKAGTPVTIGGRTYISGGIYHAYITPTEIFYDDGSPSWYVNDITELITCDGKGGRWILQLY